jgi:1-deoxy-D-xylulose-5-phosphate synthase
VVTIEDGIRIGGAGTFLIDAIRALPELERPLPPVRMLGLPLEYIPQGRPDAILARLGLDPAGVARSVNAALATEQERLHLA